MKPGVSYKNCFIGSESFQLGQSSGWIPRYVLTCHDMNVEGNRTPSYHDRLDQAFLTEQEADEFAVEEAIRWIDKNGLLPS